MKLLRVVKSDNSSKKYTAVFTTQQSVKRVHFGQKGADDYTKGANDEQRKAYRARHDKEKNQKPDTPGALSYHLLWNSRSLQQNIKDFKKRYSV